MPIRMVDDPREPDNDNGGDEGGSGFPSGPGPSAGAGNLLGLLPLLLSLFRGKRIFLLLIILGAGYFLMNRMGGNASDLNRLFTGGFLDPRQFEKASIYEPLADDDKRNPLPEAVSLQRYAPSVGDQGQQGSCVAWSSAYAARTILEAARTGQPGNDHRFSPAFLYNQIGLDNCQGSYIERAMEFMTKQGAIPYEAFPYSDQDCSRQPAPSLMREAARYRMRGFTRLTQGDQRTVLDLRAIRENLAQGAPVVIGMMVGPSFMQEMMGQDVWNPAPGDEQMMGFGGHAMCVVGYDDQKYGGAFLLMNSWGPQWGNNGFAWIRYAHFKYFVREAYGLEPMQRSGTPGEEELSCEIGLVQVHFDEGKMKTDGYVPLHLSTPGVFRTDRPLRMGARFKIEVKNNSECYVYIFGKETDGSCYTLFPYPDKDEATQSKYSPFCGITGYRLFPRDKSLMPDSLGSRDEMAVLVSRNQIDWYDLQQKMSQRPALSFADRLRKLLADRMAGDVQYEDNNNGTMQFKARLQGQQVTACLVEMDKN